MPRHLRIWAACALAALALGCATKKRVVDPSFTVPEGIVSSDLELITFQDRPAYKIQMVDRGRIGQVNLNDVDPAIRDVIALDGTGSPILTPTYAFSPGTVRGIVFNRSAAEGIEVFRTESNGAVRRVFESPVQPSRRWIDGLTEIYEFADTDPTRPADATYIVRGLIGGAAGANSPLSNSSRAAVPTLATINYTATRRGTIDPSPNAPAESTFMMRWDPVSGAARYLVQVFEYQPLALNLRQQVLTGAPTPILTEASRDIFIASVPGATTTYKVGDVIPGGKIYTYRTPRMRAEYFVRIAALDATNQLIGLTSGPTITQSSHLLLIPENRDYFANFTDPEVAGLSPAGYLLYSRGAVRVSPGETRQE